MTTATISGQSRSARKELLVGLIGTGIGASRSPALHMDEAKALGLPLRYVVIDLDERPGGATALARVLQESENAGFAGLNVTHPFKQDIIEYLHELSADARALGAVNTVVFSEGRRIGHNTDWWGFGEGFRRGLPGAVIDVVTQLGAGGAGSATAYAMMQMGTRQLRVFDIDREKAERLAATLLNEFSASQIEVVADLEHALRRCDGLINTSPVGMHKYPGMPLPSALLRPSLWVAEVVYFPLETELLRAARALKCRTVDGGGMVVFQAAEAFRLFTGIQPDAQRMLERFRTSISN
jgi:shikimate dehydrogenase